MITKKDIVGIADILVEERNFIARNGTATHLTIWRDIVARIAMFLANNNPRFDTKRFIKYIDEK